MSPARGITEIAEVIKQQLEHLPLFV